MSAYDHIGRFAPGLYVVDLDVDESRLLVPGEHFGWASAAHLQWSPDGNRLLMRHSGAIWILDLRDMSWQRVVGSWRWEDYPAWSPGGDSVLFSRSNSNLEPLTAGGMYAWDLRTQVLFRFVCADSQVTWPIERFTVSPDGGWIAYEYAAPGPDGSPNSAREIFAVRLDGSERRRLTYLQGIAEHPVWVRGSSEVAFDFVPFECRLLRWPLRHTMSVRLDGSGLHRWHVDLIDSRVQFSEFPAVDPTGLRAAVIHLDVGKYTHGKLFVMDLDGLNKRPVFRH
jgi:Tol biopolymer transport system component